MAAIDDLLVRDACQRLCLDFAAYADECLADKVATLFVENGIFDRPGQVSEGREKIQAAIAARPAEVWTRHYCSNIRIDVAPDGQSANGRSYLLLFRGHHGTAGHEIVRAEYHDKFALSTDGWRIQSRKVALLP